MKLLAVKVYFMAFSQGVNDRKEGVCGLPELA